ncbi:Csu type fimbrial protein [Psychrobacter celer]|uniref:Csu type fimbrial protein n=1 Tax=Psychrobacter celer TaxID=306572 RepID=UPI003FD2E736
MSEGKMMKIFQWHFGLYLVPLAFLLPTSNAQAAVNCTAMMASVNLGDITLANADNESITATLKYDCRNTYLFSRNVSICLAVDGGDYDQTDVFPRYMKNTTPTPSLAFTMKLPNNTIWGSRNYTGGSEYKTVVNVPGGTTTSFNVPIQISLSSGYNNISATPGNYTNDFVGGSTAMSYDVGGLFGGNINCSNKSLQSNTFPFKVQATVIKDCKVTTASDVNLGSQPANEINIPGNSNIGVTCTKTTPYNIGLAPKTPNPIGNTNGGGFLNGTGGNTDKVPYQLRSAVGTNGKKWGNNGSTIDTLTNGVTGTGSGAEQLNNVYVTVPSADFKPDTYTDTVTIHVNY